MNHCSLAREQENAPSWSPAFRLECEARLLLSMPLEQRRMELKVPARRGRVDALKMEIRRLFEARRRGR